MAASLQAHIDELVQKNRTCEHDIRRLKQALADEKERSAEIAERFKAISVQEREEWWEACGSFLAAHRIVHLRTQNEWEKERINVAYEREENRQDRLNILIRDFKLTLFQARETELEARVAELEDAVEDLNDRAQEDEEAYNTLAATFEEQVTKAVSERNEALTTLKEAKSELAKAQVRW